MAALPYWTLAALGAVAMASLAAVVVALRPSDVGVRLFAAFLVVRGVNGMGGTLTTDPSPFVAANAQHYTVAFELVAGALIAAFLLHHPRPVATARVRTAWSTAIISLAVLLGAMLILVPQTLGVLSVSAEGRTSFAQVAPGYILGGAFFAACGVAAFLFARAARGARGDARSGWSFLFLAFGLDVVFVATYRITSFFDSAIGDQPIAIARFALILGAGAMTLLAGAMLVRSATSPQERREARIIGGLLLLALASGLALNAYVETLPLEERFIDPLAIAVRALWRFPLPLLAAYALVRHSLFDIDVRIKWGIRQGTLAAIFVGVVFVASESAATFFQGSIGPYAGIAAAGLLVFLLAPLQRVAERVADAAMPGTRGLAERPDAEGAYRTALDLALADGVISRVEERALARLQSQLRLDPERALALREEAEAARAAA